MQCLCFRAREPEFQIQSSQKVTDDDGVRISNATLNQVLCIFGYR